MNEKQEADKCCRSRSYGQKNTTGPDEGSDPAFNQCAFGYGFQCINAGLEKKDGLNAKSRMTPATAFLGPGCSPIISRTGFCGSIPACQFEP